MKRTINAKDAEWPPEVVVLWESFAPDRPPGPVLSANYFTARPYRDEYNRGSDTHGFVYVVGREVWLREWLDPSR